MPKEDKAWEKLYEKYRPKPKKVKKPISKKKISTIVGSVLACLSVLFIFLYFNYFALPLYRDVNAGLASMIASEGDTKYALSGLPTGRCYWIRPMYNETGHFVEIIEYRAEDSCIGVTTNKTVIRLDSALNIGTSDCICSKSGYTMTKTLDEYGISLKMVEK